MQKSPENYFEKYQKQAVKGFAKSQHIQSENFIILRPRSIQNLLYVRQSYNTLCAGSYKDKGWTHTAAKKWAKPRTAKY